MKTVTKIQNEYIEEHKTDCIDSNGSFTQAYTEWLQLKVTEAIEKQWVSVGMPKNGTKIIRWNKVWKVPMCVYYKLDLSGKMHLEWITGDNSNSYPEASFLPNFWQPLPPKPTEKNER